MDGGGMRRRKRFSCGNILGDPFALATISIGFLGWILALVASIIAATEAPFPKYNWWTLAFMFFVILGVTVVEGANVSLTYNVAIVGYLSAGIVMTSSAVQTTIYSGVPASEAAAAGFILLAVVCIIWVFYFGSQPQSTPRSHVDSFALGKKLGPSRHDSMNQTSIRPVNQQGSAIPWGEASNRTNLFENPRVSRFGIPAGSSPHGRSQNAFQVEQGYLPQGGIGNNNNNQINIADDRNSSTPSVRYDYKAKAMYTYEANPEDATEISFTKGEILDISDVSGRWWMAKKANGQTGIAPSNYVTLL